MSSPSSWLCRARLLRFISTLRRAGGAAAATCVAFGLLVGIAAPASAASGDLVGTVAFSQDCSSGLGTGITFDGTNLWVSCFMSNPDLMRANPVTGQITATYNIQDGLGSIAYDAARNVIWAAQGGATSGIQKIALDAGQNVTGTTLQFDPGPASLVDGLGYDATDDSFYWSPDSSTTISHFSMTGALLDTKNFAGNGCYNSGVAIGGDLLFEGSDGCGHVWVVNKTTDAPAFDFSTVVAADPNFRDEGLSCDTKTFAAQQKQVMWSKEAYSPNRAAAFEIPDGTCGIGGQPASPTTLTTTLRGGGSSGPKITVPTNTPVTDSSSLAGTNAATAGGTVSYAVYSDANCTNPAGDGGTKPVTAGAVPDSDPVSLGTAGTYYWQAKYSGDPANSASQTLCGDEIETVGTPPSGHKLSIDGNGRIRGDGKTEIDIDLIRKHDGHLKGAFEFTSSQPRAKFESSKILTLDAVGNMATASGTGEFNGHGGYTFTLVVVDNHDNKHHPDTISIEVRDASGNVVFTTNGVQPMDRGGDIDVE